MKLHHYTCIAAAMITTTAFADQKTRIQAAKDQEPPALHINTGHEIPSEGYCDQPYVVKLKDGTWLCVMTTGAGKEGSKGQLIVSTRSKDYGKTWEPLVGIEPATGPEASWAMPYLTASGRVYVFYTYNAENRREVAGAGKRVDTIGEYALKYSDDGGKSWSKERWFIPIRATTIDHKNPYKGKVRFFWGVGKPILHKGALYLGFSKIGSYGRNWSTNTESWFLKCVNIESEEDPDKLKWELLPEGEEGLKSPKGSVAEEVNLTALSDGSLFCTYRTIAGHPCHAYSRDDGKTWTPPAFMTNKPGGELLKQPRAANFVRKLEEGPYKGRFIYWFHDNSSQSWGERNPAYLLGGIEKDSPEGKVIHWGKPVAILYDENPKLRMSYPDFIWDDGALHVTETQKHVARVHRIPDALLKKLWD